MSTRTCIAMIRRITTLTSIRMTEVTHCPSFLFTGHFLPCSDERPSPSRSKPRQQVVIKESPDGDGNLVVERSPSSGDTLWIK